MTIDLGDGVVFDPTSLESDSGTGNYSTILRVQATPTEQGFNTDDNGNVLDNKASFTNAIQFSNLESVNVGGVDYFVIRFDLNQNDNIITLNTLKLYSAATPATLDDYNHSTGVFASAPLYTYSGAQSLSETGSGSGHDDGGFYIPVSIFANAGVTGGDYLTLYADFSNSNGGFEEFRALTAEGNPALTVVKTAAIDDSAGDGHGGGNGDGLLDYAGDVIKYTITVTNTGDVGLTDPAFPYESLGLTLTPDAPGGINVGDANGNGVFDPTEAWVYNAYYTLTQADLDKGGNTAVCGTFSNTVTARAADLSNVLLVVQDTSTADVQLTLIPKMAVEKTAEVLNFDNSHDSDQKVDAVGDQIAYTFTITNTGNTALHDVTISDPTLAGMGTTLQIASFSGDTDGDTLLDVNESWTYTATIKVTQSIFDAAVANGDTLTNTVTVSATDCCGDPAGGQLTDGVTVDFLPPVNTARTPGFWYNNGSQLWDGNDATFPKGGNLGFDFLGKSGDLAKTIYDLNGDGKLDTTTQIDGVKDNATGSRQYLMIGDWSGNGIADHGENVLVVSRDYALSLLNASTKQVQDGRYMVARDLVASWLNVLGHTPAGDAQDLDSVRHYIDEGIAWLIQTTNGNHVLATDELKQPFPVPTSASPWQAGYDGNGDLTKGGNMVSAAFPDILGGPTATDILAGSVIHTGLDHFNNFGFV
jgi:uncharacterized repeat protein (TIGR01451 family)